MAGDNTGTSLDKRRNAYRPDLAAESLRGRVAAPRYIAGERRQVAAASVAVRGEPDERSPWTTEALHGEAVTVLDQQGIWAWGQLAGDGYVGYLSAAALSGPVRQPTHRVRALGTALYPAADVKSGPVLHLSLNAGLIVERAAAGEVFARLADGRFVPAAHIAPVDRFAPDFVTVAEGFLGTPYVWGGKTRQGLDCSGLVQVALQAAGLPCPRDSDMQQAEVGEDVTASAGLGALRRGDLVFWPGHVGVMLDPQRLLHANAHHMAVAAEPLREAVARIGAAIAVKRPTAPSPHSSVG